MKLFHSKKVTINSSPINIPKDNSNQTDYVSHKISSDSRDTTTSSTSSDNTPELSPRKISNNTLTPSNSPKTSASIFNLSSLISDIKNDLPTRKRSSGNKLTISDKASEDPFFSLHNNTPVSGTLSTESSPQTSPRDSTPNNSPRDHNSPFVISVSNPLNKSNSQKWVKYSIHKQNNDNGVIKSTTTVVDNMNNVVDDLRRRNTSIDETTDSISYRDTKSADYIPSTKQNTSDNRKPINRSVSEKTLSSVTRSVPMTPIEKPHMYLIFNVDADGLCPGLNSLKYVSFCGYIPTQNNQSYKLEYDREFHLQPLAWCAADVEENIDRFSNKPGGIEFKDPLKTFIELRAEIVNLKKKYRVIIGTWIASSEYQWINYYFCALAASNPLGTSVTCISTLHKTKIFKRTSLIPPSNVNPLSITNNKINSKQIYEHGIIWMNIVLFSKDY
jgi:hypothetical protein